jgi:Phage shock protein A (IM30), suppresses sigma54-dependent transcription
MDYQSEADRSVQEHTALSRMSRIVSTKLIGTILAIAYVCGSGFYAYQLNQRLAQAEESQKTVLEAVENRNSAIANQVETTESSLKQSTAALRKTQRQISARSDALRKQVNETEKQLQESQKLLASMSNELGGVKTDLSGARNDISSTRTDLEATKKRLDTTIGDLGLQSGLIAHTRDDLELLKHRGDRNYYEFTLAKSKHPTPVGTVSLQLKKVNARKGNFTMDVIADDHVIEKKDRNVAEPLQFYTGRDRMLYEVVVFTANKKSVSGYLATPKNAPQPGAIRDREQSGF